MAACQTFDTAGIQTAIPPTLLQGPTAYRDAPMFSPFLVVLRYPSQVDAAALPRIRSGIRASLRGSGIERQVGGIPDSEIDRAILNQLVKTTYYSFELYEYLSRRLPPGSLTLQPTRATVDGQGRLRTETAGLLPPAVLILDFQVSVHPIDVLKFGDHTFGHWVRPEIGLTTAVQAWPSTIGTIATRGAYEPTFVFDPLAGPEGAGRTSYLNDLNKASGLFRATVPGYKERQYSALPIKWDRLLQLPKITYSMPTEEIVAQSKTPSGPGERPPAAALYEMISGMIAGALTEADQYLATRDAWIKYISLYDPDLARRWPRWPRSEVDALAVRLIGQFAETERQFLTQQDATIVREAYRGAFGDSMRKLFVAEFETRERTAEAVDRANALAMLTIMTSVLTRDAGRSISQLAALDQQLARELTGLTGALRNHFGRIQTQQVSYVIKAAEGEREVRGRTLAELRDDMKEIYLATVRRPVSDTAQSPAPAGDGWLRDKRTGCHLWYGSSSDVLLYGPERNMGDLDVEWSGPCRDGKAHGYGLARFLKHRFYFGEVDGTFEDGRARGRATALLTLATEGDKASKGYRWMSLVAPYDGPSRVSIVYFTERTLDGTKSSGGYFQSSFRWTQYRAPGNRAMTTEEISTFETERKQFRTFRMQLIPR